MSRKRLSAVNLDSDIVYVPLHLKHMRRKGRLDILETQPVINPFR